MKFILDIFNKVKPNFEQGGKLHAAKPLYDAMENFCFGPATRTILAPHARDPLDVKRFMSMVIVALIPCLFAAFYFFGLRVLAMIIVSYAAGGVVEVAFAIIRKEEINEGFLVTGLLFPLILPPTLPLWMVAVGVMFGVFVGKELFGGTGRNLFNPALVGRCFLALAYPVAMGASWVIPGSGMLGRLTQYITPDNTDALTQATPLISAKSGQLADLQDLFMGSTTGCVGETSFIAILIGAVILVAVGVANWRTIVGVLGSFMLLGSIMHWIMPETFGFAHWHLMAGGLMFGAVFMATDPVTSPITNEAKWVYAILIGSATVLIRNLTGYVEGMMFAILLGNIFAPILDEVAIRFRLRRLQREE